VDDAQRKGPPGPPPRPGRAPHGGAATPSNPQDGAGVSAAVSLDALPAAISPAHQDKTDKREMDAKESGSKSLNSARSFMLKKDTASKDKAAETEKQMAQEDDDSDSESVDGDAKLNPCVRFMYAIATNQYFSGFMMLVTLFALFGDGECEHVA